LVELTAGLSGAVSGQGSTSPDGSSDADEVCMTNNCTHIVSMNRQKICMELIWKAI
jgi:hypothetical protein